MALGGQDRQGLELPSSGKVCSNHPIPSLYGPRCALPMVETYSTIRAIHSSVQLDMDSYIQETKYCWSVKLYRVYYEAPWVSYA